MKKRGRSSIKRATGYIGPNGIEVMQLILYYGFNRMNDMITFSSTSKFLRDWSRRHILTVGMSHTFIKYAGKTPIFICQGMLIPSKGLLEKMGKNGLKYMETWITPSRPMLDIKHVHYTIFSCTICYMLLHYDRDGGSWSYEIFNNPSSYIRPTVKFRYVPGSATDINGIDVHLHANQC